MSSGRTVKGGEFRQLPLKSSGFRVGMGFLLYEWTGGRGGEARQQRPIDKRSWSLLAHP